MSASIRLECYYCGAALKPTHRHDYRQVPIDSTDESTGFTTETVKLPEVLFWGHARCDDKFCTLDHARRYALRIIDDRRALGADPIRFTLKK